jgi:hypothetical protein
MAGGLKTKLQKGGGMGGNYRPGKIPAFFLPKLYAKSLPFTVNFWYNFYGCEREIPTGMM